MPDLIRHPVAGWYWIADHVRNDNSHLKHVCNFQVFSICENSSSTGVARPKIVTATRTLLFS